MANAKEMELEKGYKYKELENIFETLTMLYKTKEENSKQYSWFHIEKAIEKVDNAMRVHKKFKAKERQHWEKWEKKNQTCKFCVRFYHHVYSYEVTCDRQQTCVGENAQNCAKRFKEPDGGTAVQNGQS